MKLTKVLASLCILISLLGCNSTTPNVHDRVRTELTLPEVSGEIIFAQLIETNGRYEFSNISLGYQDSADSLTVSLNDGKANYNYYIEESCATGKGVEESSKCKTENSAKFRFWSNDVKKNIGMGIASFGVTTTLVTYGVVSFDFDKYKKAYYEALSNFHYEDNSGLDALSSFIADVTNEVRSKESEIASIKSAHSDKVRKFKINEVIIDKTGFNNTNFNGFASIAEAASGEWDKEVLASDSTQAFINNLSESSSAYLNELREFSKFASVICDKKYSGFQYSFVCPKTVELSKESADFSAVITGKDIRLEYPTLKFEDADIGIYLTPRGLEIENFTESFVVIDSIAIYKAKNIHSLKSIAGKSLPPKSTTHFENFRELRPLTINFRNATLEKLKSKNLIYSAAVQYSVSDGSSSKNMKTLYKRVEKPISELLTPI